MLLVDIYIDKSPIQGIGVFAKRFIAKGATIWTLDQRFDRLIETELYESMTGRSKTISTATPTRAAATRATSSSRPTTPAT